VLQVGTGSDDSLGVLFNDLNTVGRHRFFGHEGNDTMIGAKGGDTFHGGVGADRMEGNEGSDIYYIEPAEADTVASASDDMSYMDETDRMVRCIAAYRLPRAAQQLQLKIHRHAA